MLVFSMRAQLHTGMVTLAGEVAWIAGEVAALLSNIHLMPPS
jgi:hypothetical protein